MDDPAFKAACDAALHRYYHTEQIDTGFEPSLSNGVHPLFQWFERWSSHDDTLLDSDEELTLTSRRLASRYVTAECALPFWYTMFFGKRTKLASPPDRPQQLVFEIEETKEPLTTQQIADTKRRLLDLAEFAPFHVSKFADLGHDVSMSCLPRPEYADISDPEVCAQGGITTPFTGDFATIDVPSATMEAFRKGMASDSVYKAWAIIHFANTLVHEMAHAAMHATAVVKLKEYASTGSYPCYYIGKSIVAEDGYEWESRLFGGLITNKFSRSSYYTIDGVDTELKGMLTIADWPHSEKVAQYMSGNRAIAIRGEAGTAWLEWRLPFSFLADLLSDEFWEERVSKEGLVALRPRRELGVLCDLPIPDAKPMRFDVGPEYDIVAGSCCAAEAEVWKS